MINENKSNKIKDKRVKEIFSKILESIDSSKIQINIILDNTRQEYETLVNQLENIKIEIDIVIKTVDILVNEDKSMRIKLVKATKNYKNNPSFDLKKIYDEAYAVKSKLLEAENKERNLRDRRDNIELSLRKVYGNIKISEKILHQIGIASSFLNGEIMSAMEGMDFESEMLVGVKVLEAQENERKRIARDIHDGPAQLMANLIMRTDICETILKKDFEEGIKELRELKIAVKKSLKEVRDIIFDLRPMSLDDIGLNQTIKEFINIVSRDLEMKINFNFEKINYEVESIIKVATYRIIQELLNNIKKHSKAKNVSIDLKYGKKYLSIKVEDDGIGFDVRNVLSEIKSKSNSFGLIGIYERVNQLQGEINITSENNKGVVFKIKLPISREVILDEKNGN
ncbi:sensor histidine kinase [Helicovermis profundi]|uniref:histidine kinase n=1 Tax=Helicovermis profundi TaxID=3065157 RepID=A0AAU9E0D9_9FIRM|nr:two-component sensor histidine kinase DegS [Clostridia bacterium S502]